MDNRSRGPFYFQIKSSTWLKDSHSLFDYQTQKIDCNTFTFPINTKAVSIYRKRGSSNVIAFDDGLQPTTKADLEQYQFLTKFQVKHMPNSPKLRLEFDKQSVPKLKKMSSERLNTDQSNSACQNKQQDTYMVVRKIKDNNNEQEGFKLMPGCTIKLGRVEYFVSEAKENGVVTKATRGGNGACNFNNKVFKVEKEGRRGKDVESGYQTQEEEGHQVKNACKICLDQTDTPDNFLFNPCLCTGSCGTVHIQCLTKWIDIKVKKQTIGGTMHFNFNKFECQVCKLELPMIVQSNNVQKQLLPIEKPQGNYLILEGACQKTKSVMLIQNVPAQGIKLGRGHECQIRITDISVSRNHASIKNIGSGFYVFDSKSKFGTLVKTEPLNLELGKNPRVLQIGRTVLSVQIQKQSSLKQPRTEVFLRNKATQ